MGDILKAPSSKVSSIETSFSTYESNLKNALSYGEAITNIISDQYLLYGWTKILNKMDKIINKKDKIKEWGTNYIDNLKTLESKLPENPGFSLSYSALSLETATRTASKPNLSTYKNNNRDGEIIDPDSETSTSESSSETTSTTTSGGYSSYSGGGYSGDYNDTNPSSGGSSSSTGGSEYSTLFNFYKKNGYSDQDAAKKARNSMNVSDYEKAKAMATVNISTVRRSTNARVQITSKPTTTATLPPLEEAFPDFKPVGTTRNSYYSSSSITTVRLTVPESFTPSYSKAYNAVSNNQSSSAEKARQAYNLYNKSKQK